MPLEKPCSATNRKCMLRPAKGAMPQRCEVSSDCTILTMDCLVHKTTVGIHVIED